ncbi:MAG: PAS domain S-box protein [Cyclobacteriaceae bacterium]
MMGRPDNDKRLADILATLKRFARGEYGGHVSTSDSEGKDEIDAIRTAVNELGDVLSHRHETLLRNGEKIQNLLDVMLRYTLLDFSERAAVHPEGDEIDALAVGLNALGEEVIDHMNRLEDSQAQIHAIFRNAPDGVLVIDRNDVIVEWNPAASIIFGWEEHEVKGKYLNDTLVPHEYRERHLAGMRHFFETGHGPVLGRTIELPALRKDNSQIPVELTISPAKLNDNFLFIAFVRDITGRKKTEEQILQLNATLEQRVLERTEELNASEQRYRHLFENNPMPLWVADMETHRFVDVNESALKHYGYDREEFLSMTALDLRPEDERKRYLDLNRGMRGTRNTGIWKHCKKDGTIIFAEVIAHEMNFEGKTATLVLAHDVTEETKARRALEISEARFRRVIDSKMTGFFFWDADGKITDANDLFLDMVGFTRSDLEEQGMNLHAITPPEYVEAQMQALEQIRATGVCEPFEKEYIRKDGTRFPVFIGAANINDATLIKGVTFVMDISQRKKMEQEILELNRDLEFRIGERTRALKEANQELESFSYSVSHDLRAPLRAIHGYSQMLTEDHESKLDQEGLRLLNAVKYNAMRMGQLVDDLLAFSRLGKRTMSESEIDLTKLVHVVLKDFSETGKSRAKICVHPLGTTMADVTLLRQALQNLVSNALKYSSKKDQPEIEIGVIGLDGVPTYYVKDNGAGFDMAYYQKLFGVFQRLHGQEEFEGTGVGLAIVQRIIHRHGGTIWAESKEGEGATFYFTLRGRDNTPFPDSDTATAALTAIN